MYDINSDNCNVCGNEFLIKELNSLKALSTNFKICHNCLRMSNPANDYMQVKNIIYGYLKVSQQAVDTELASPEIKIEPMETNINAAVELLKKINPNYFIGVRKIVVDIGSGFGHVSSGGNEDPAVIHINLPKIKSEIQNKIGNLPKDQQNKKLIRQIAIIISHERGHISSYKPELGFQGGEASAETEENSMSKKVDNYYNALK